MLPSIGDGKEARKGWLFVSNPAMCRQPTNFPARTKISCWRACVRPSLLVEGLLSAD